MKEKMSIETETSRQSDEIDLGALVGVVWRGKWWIILFATLGVLAAWYYGTRVAVPMYPARVSIALEGEEQQRVLGDIESIFGGGGTGRSELNTEMEVLRSRELIGRLVDELQLIDDREFNGIRDTPRLRDRIRMALTDWEPSTPTPETLRRRAIDRLIARISIINISDSLVFNLQIQTTDPNKSVYIVNALAEIYIDNSVRVKLEDATRAILFLSERTTELEATLEQLEQDLAQRMEASDAIDATLLQAQNLQLRDLRTRVEDAQVNLAQDLALREAVDAIPEGADRLDALLGVLEPAADPRFTNIIARFRSGRLEADATEIALMGIVDDLDDDIRRTRTQLASLQASADTLTLQIGAQSNELIAMQQLTREVDAARLLYQTFLTRLQEASIQQGLETPDARVLSQAVRRGASSPRVTRLIIMAAFAGAFLGIAVAMVRDWRFAGFRTTDELGSTTGSPVLGSLPEMKVRDRKEVLRALKNNPNTVFAEAVRNLRTSILMTNPDVEPQLILVTSSIPGEGKTTLALALARYFGSLEGRRVLLMEADIRRQTLRAYMDEDRSHGAKLLDVLLGKARLDDLDLVDPDLGVEVLMGSGGEFNAADLFESRRFRDLLTTLRGRYDHIIIDSPPVLAVPDARVLARYADLRIFAVRWGFTTKTQVRQGLDMLNSVGFPASGTVLTQVNHKKMKAYGYAGQYGYDDDSSGYYNKD